MKIAIPNSFYLCFYMLSLPFAGLQGQEIQWMTDLNQAIVKAEAEKRLVLLHFTAAWSNPCKEIDSYVFSSQNVERAIASNVIPVRIDVDEQPELAAEYGVAKVPYDIMLTPGKRIVYRRHSPKDSANYALMIQRLERTIQSISKNGMSTINQNLDDLKQLNDIATKPIQEDPGFTPPHPAHQAPRPSENSQEMNRKFGPVQSGIAPNAPQYQSSTLGQVVANPFTAAKPENQSQRTPGPLRILNEKFFTPESNGAQSLAKAAPVEDGLDSKSSRLVAATMQPNLQRAPDTSSSGNFTSNPLLASSSSLEVQGTRAGRESSPPESKSNDQVAVNSLVNADFNNSSADSSKESPAADPPSFALKGKCPVALIQEGRWVSGDQRWGCIHRGQTYTFASEDNLRVFQSDPDAYSPLLSGYDPVVYSANGQLVLGKEEHGVFMGKAPNLRVVLFRDFATRKEFESNPKKYIQSIRVAMENSGGSSSLIR